MSKELNITENVMQQINEGKIKMKPRIYFIAGSILTFVGLVFSITTSIFLINLIKFYFRTHGKMAEYRFEQMLANFPWWTALFAIVTLLLGIWLIKKYEFSYKKKPFLIIIGFVLAIIFVGIFVDIAGFNDSIIRKNGKMKNMMNGYYPKGYLNEIRPNR
ncbi:MAG: hypothetical protein NDI62_02615 [Burkholderiales bacterium]|nr:hypothetical protein [Burkholderiales bacterium]